MSLRREILCEPSGVCAQPSDGGPVFMAKQGDSHALECYNSRLPKPRYIVPLILLFLISLPAVTVRFYASDEIEYFAYLRSMWFDGDLSFDNEYRYFYDRGVARGWRFKEAFLDGETPTGLRTNFAPVGSAILWAPFYVLTDAGVRVANALGAEVPADGFAKPYIAAVVYGSAIYGFLAVLLSAHIASRITGSWDAAVGAAFAVWTGTPLLFYMYLAPGFSHACSAFAVAAFVFVWLNVRRQWSWPGILGLGAMAAIIAMVREQDLFLAIGPALDFLVAAVRRVREREWPLLTAIARGLAGALTAAICFLPQLLAYMVLFGRPAPSPTIENKMTWTSPHAWQVLASPENGLLFWTPLAIAALAGLVWLAARSWVAFICVVMVLTQVYVSGSLDTWAGAGAFGQRRLVGLTVFVVLGLAALLAAIPRGWPRYALQAFVVLAVWWNVGLTAQFGSGLMNRQHLDPPRNAYHNFVTVPQRIPDLMYRFLFDRASFYQQRPLSTP